MRAVVQRVSSGSVSVDGEPLAEQGLGLFVLVGLRAGDTVADAVALAGKVSRLRVFEDAAGKMNLSVREAGGSLVVVSEFTLYGDARKGNRPSYADAMPVEEAREFWPRVEAAFRDTGIPCGFGRYQAMMTCDIRNEGPVTILVEIP